MATFYAKQTLFSNLFQTRLERIQTMSSRNYIRTSKMQTMRPDREASLADDLLYKLYVYRQSVLDDKEIPKNMFTIKYEMLRERYGAVFSEEVMFAFESLIERYLEEILVRALHFSNKKMLTMFDVEMALMSDEGYDFLKKRVANYKKMLEMEMEMEEGKKWYKNREDLFKRDK